MKNLLAKIVALVARRPTTEKAIAGITKALDHLDAVVVAENEELNRLDDKITKAAKQRMDAFARRDRAAQVAQRFADLVA
ncbi:hypothetical protein CN074_25025 [Sinorhizobium medicae]|uniref:hypothetical protein n=1 Tax=Sinorhizobium medicae TaxID=110321 RepID=UPI000FDB9A4B|nr:hypothetical protein [Sinorhizobium medicae]RVP63860.1 hypothetical protein CN074_25025 [Sinorhizobium medicae]